MTLSAERPIARLAIRDLLVIASAIGFIFAIFLGLSKAFDSLSYLMAVAIGASAVIMFGWSCYMGHHKTMNETRQIQ